MRMPGFTAEASIGKTKHRYALTPRAAAATREGIVPQRMPCGCGWSDDFGWVCYCPPGARGGPVVQ
jgi:hypothetical protein